MSLDLVVDVAIVGAGSAGAAAAAFLAERGVSVAVVERRPLELAGARWVNGVPRAAFDEAGVDLPGPGERRGGPSTFHLVAPGGDHPGARARIVVTGHDVIEVDMRGLVARLQARARAAGAQLVGEVSVLGLTPDGIRTSAGPVRARRVIDASGLAGARLLDQPAPAREHLCAAAQEIRRVRDPAAARAFFAAHRVPPGEVLGLTGQAGGYSVVNVHLSEDGDEVSILTGSVPALGHPSGKALLDRFVAEHPWVGERVFGGAGPIPLRRPYDRLATDRVALLGDAGCQVFPAHGSGVGAGMIAARLLADVLAGGGDLRDYEVAWHRRRSGLHAAYDVLRRWNQGLDAAQLERLIGSGVLDPQLARAGLDQRLPAPRPRTLARQVRALATEPALRGSLVGAAARAALARALYGLYPRAARAMPVWGRAIAAVFGETPDAPGATAHAAAGVTAAQPAGDSTSSYAS